MDIKGFYSFASLRSMATNLIDLFIYFIINIT